MPNTDYHVQHVGCVVTHQMPTAEARSIAIAHPVGWATRRDHAAAYEPNQFHRSVAVRRLIGPPRPGPWKRWAASQFAPPYSARPSPCFTPSGLAACGPPYGYSGPRKVNPRPRGYRTWLGPMPSRRAGGRVEQIHSQRSVALRPTHLVQPAVRWGNGNHERHHEHHGKRIDVIAV